MDDEITNRLNFGRSKIINDDDVVVPAAKLNDVVTKWNATTIISS